MPYKFETEKMLIPRDKKKNVKVTLEQRKEIARLYKTGEYSQRELAKMYNIGRKLVYLYADETGERLRKSMEMSKERNKKYFRQTNSKAVNETRKRKKELYLRGELIGGDNGKEDKKSCI